MTDVFEAFRDACLKNYGLDPAHFYTAPGLAWQALLKTAAEYHGHEKRRTECELCPGEFRLELLPNLDMLLMVGKCIQGGITQAVKHYARANNKFMKDLYNLAEHVSYTFSLSIYNLIEHISSICGCKQPLRMNND